MIREPSCPPTKDATAAGATKPQSTSARTAWVAKPAKDEKQTMKTDEAAAVRVDISFSFTFT